MDKVRTVKDVEDLLIEGFRDEGMDSIVDFMEASEYLQVRRGDDGLKFFFSDTKEMFEVTVKKLRHVPSDEARRMFEC